MIGITLNCEKGLMNAHLRNDFSTNAYEQAQNIALIALNTNAINHRVLKTSIEHISKNQSELKAFIEKHQETIETTSPETKQCIHNVLKQHAPDLQLTVNLDTEQQAEKRPKAAKPN